MVKHGDAGLKLDKYRCDFFEVFGVWKFIYSDNENIANRKYPFEQKW